MQVPYINVLSAGIAAVLAGAVYWILSVRFALLIISHPAFSFHSTHVTCLTLKEH